MTHFLQFQMTEIKTFPEKTCIQNRLDNLRTRNHVVNHTPLP